MITLVASCASFLFAGGDIGAFAQTVSEWADRPVVALIQTRRLRSWSIGAKNPLPEFGTPLVRKFEIGLNALGDGKDFRRLVRVKGDLEVAPKSGIGIWQPAWEPETIYPMTTRSAPPGWNLDLGDSVKIKGGKVFASLKPQTFVTLDRLMALPWSKPVDAMWLYRPMFLVPVSKGCSEKAFLEAIASAAGADLKETKDQWTFDLDLSEFRRRAQEYAKRSEGQGESPRLAMAYKQLLIEAWRQVSDEDLRQVLRAPKQSRFITVAKGTPLYAALGHYLEAHYAFAQSPPRGFEQVAKTRLERLGRIDFSRVLQVGFAQNLQVVAGYGRQGGGTIVL